MSKLVDDTVKVLDRRNSTTLGAALLTTLWVYGLVLAHGFGQMAVAIIVPVYSWYLAIESITKYLGLGV